MLYLGDTIALYVVSAFDAYNALLQMLCEQAKYSCPIQLAVYHLQQVTLMSYIVVKCDVPVYLQFFGLLQNGICV